MSRTNSDIAHDLRQPLNVITLVSANLRGRLSGVLTVADAAYLDSKLNRIENQLAIALQLLDALSLTDNSTSGLDFNPR